MCLHSLAHALTDGKRCSDRYFCEVRLLFPDRVGCGVHGLLACYWLTRRPHNTSIAWTLYDVGLDFRHCSLDLERVLDADDLVHSVAKSG